MKRTFALLAFCALLMLCVMPPASADQMGWSSSVSPDFAFNGDEVELTVTGVPNQFAFVKVRLGNETVDDLLIVLDEMGRGEQNWTVPILAETGTYQFIVVSGGLNVTVCSLSVIYDDVTYLTHLVGEMQERNDQLEKMVLGNAKQTDGVQGQLFWIWLAGTIGVAGFIGMAFLTFMFYAPAGMFLIRTRAHDRRNRGRSDFYKGLFDPDVDGLMTHARPTLLKDMEPYRVDDETPEADAVDEKMEIMDKKDEGPSALRRLRDRMAEGRMHRGEARAAREIEEARRKIAEYEAAVPKREAEPPEKAPAVDPDADKLVEDAVTIPDDETPEEAPAEAVEEPRPKKRTSAASGTAKKRTAPRKKPEAVKKPEGVSE